ncbi:glycoside hydrolase domain-containing protein [Arthrobacter sp. GMC3]|uniref:glycoside hydrolase domain-containing protein n=1 Tax=Arthrobacter sp. GMC3 TaxID=2058894 RepID=UPI0015E3787E|nr:glycoside hydrolase domain-containing protein [Arthrobacter sp. GMC3]
MSISKVSPRLRRLKAGAAAGLAAALALSLAPTAFSSPAVAAPEVGKQIELTQFVNPLIGTAVSSTSGYAGNISPGAKMPFGMVTFGPDMSRKDYNGSGGYLVPASATEASVNFFSLTHLNGVGCPGQGVVGMLPRTTPTSVSNASGVPQQPAKFQTSTESASPGEYSVTLDSGVRVELGATERTGIARFTYPSADEGYFSLDTRLNGTSNSTSTRGKVTPENVSLKISDDGKVLSGKTVAPAFCIPWGTAYNSNVYFYAEFDKPMKAQGDSSSTVNKEVNGSTVLQYDLPANDPTLNMRVGISPVSVENAELNLRTENETSSLEQVKTAAVSKWNTRLNSVQVDQAANPSALSPEQRTNLEKFYTSLYRVLGSPTIYSDVNGDFRSLAAQKPLAAGVDPTGAVEERAPVNVADYSYTKPDGGKGSYSTHYSGLSLWDTYRSQAQLLAILAPDVASDVAQSIVVDGMQCGALPHWVDASDDSTPMSGDNALPVLAGSYAFGARDFDVVTAAKLVKQSAFDPNSACNGNKSFPNSASYLDYGYFTDADHASANIERFNSDHGAYSFLTAVGEDVRSNPQVSVTGSDLEKLAQRTELWKNMVDPATGKLIARKAPTTPGTLGEIVTPGSFHESTEPNYFWSFGQSWDDLIEATGGNEAAIERLNALFSMNDELTAKPTLKQLNGGQDAQTYYMGNEPGYQAPWAYNWAGRPAASQYVVSQLRDTAFSTARDGMPGNDDMGAQSSWFVFASLGLFPVSPSDPGLAISSPLFPAATVWVDGKPTRIAADGDPTAAPFIASMEIDGHAYGRSWMKADTLRQGGNVSFKLSSTPTEWASDVHPTGAAATTTTMDLSGKSLEIGSATPVNADITVTSADQTLPKGTVEIRNGNALLATAPLGGVLPLAKAAPGSAGASVTIPITVPNGTPVSVMKIAATFVPEDPSFLAVSASEVAEIALTAPVPTSTESPAPSPSMTSAPPADTSKGDSSQLASTGLPNIAGWILLLGLLAAAAGVTTVMINRRRAG